MARDDDFKAQLGGFMRAALAQLETVREVVVQKSRAGKIQLDVAMLKRQRRDILAELGAVIARLATNGRLSEDDFPELGGPLARLEAIDERIDTEAAHARRVSMGVSESDEDRDPFDAPEPDDHDEHASAVGELCRGRPRADRVRYLDVGDGRARVSVSRARARDADGLVPRG